MMMVVPIDADGRQLQLQHHDGDDDREDAITEGFKSVRLHFTDVTGRAWRAAID